MTSTTTSTPTSCTVVTGPAMARCGAPAVTTFTSRSGEVFAECTDHAAPVSTPAPLDTVKAGDLVRVTHVGLSKLGTVVEVRRTQATVRVPLADGSTKVITRPIAELS